MKQGLRTYYIVPAAIMTVLFLCAGSWLTSKAILTEEQSNSISDEIWIVYFAMGLQDKNLPESISNTDLAAFLSALDRNTAYIAENISIVSYKRKETADYNGTVTGCTFEMEIRHRGDPGRTYRMNEYGFN